MSAYDTQITAYASDVSFYPLAADAADGKDGNSGTPTSVTFGSTALLANGDKSATFDGSNSLVTVAAASNLNLTGNFSVEAWINAADLTGGGIVEKTVGGVVVTQWLLFVEGGHVSFRLIGLGSIPDAIFAISTNTTYHVVATYDSGTGVYCLYINAVLQATHTVSGGGQTAGGSGVMYIGTLAQGLYRFNGRIAKVAIYNAVLALSDVVANRNAGLVSGPAFVALEAADDIESMGGMSL